VKKTAVDRFNDNRQEESHRLNLKRKMEHDERMASINLKKHKYDLRYGSTTPQTPDSSTQAFATAAASKEDKQIEILRLQIRLAELNRDNSAHASSHASSSLAHASSSRASSSRMAHNSLEELSTPSSGMSSLPYNGGHSYNDNNNDSEIMTYGDPGPSRYHETSGGDMTSYQWPDTYNFSADS
jgi:hypothetical protein